MRSILITLPLSSAKDMAHARIQLRDFCITVGVGTQDTTRYTTAVSEVMRRALNHGGGTLELAILAVPVGSAIEAVVRDMGQARAPAPRSFGDPSEGLNLARRLIESLAVDPQADGSLTIIATQPLPGRSPPTADRLEDWRSKLQRRSGVTADELLAQQNRELTQTLLELQRRETEISARIDEIRELNRELQDTNRGLLTIHQELANSNSKLDRARHAAEAATATKAAFLANMSHEIRTPMHAVLAMTDLLRDTPLDGEQREYADTAQASAAHLLAVINDILDFSKIETGKLDLEMRAFSLRDCLDEAIDMVALGAGQKQLELISQIEPGTPAAIVGDITRVRQVLTNLLSNAVKFTVRGEVAVSVAARHLGNHQYEVRFSVRDTGVGIEADAFGRLFQSFNQADAATAREFGGTGLGLAISKQLTELMGGDIGAESTPGQGSTFWFTIRASAAELSKLASDESATLLRDKHLLIVGGSNNSRVMLKAAAQSWGMQVSETGQYGEALDRVRRGESYDVCLIKALADDLGGEKLAQDLRAIRSEKELPLLLGSSVARNTSRNPLFVAVLARPIRLPALRRVLEDVFTPGESGKLLLAPDRDLLRRRGRDQLGMKLLLAEDNPVNQKVATKILQILGCSVEVVDNGRDAVRLAEIGQFDLILMDMHMPIMDGLDATREICRRIPREHRPRIVAFTANALLGDRERCLAAGMDDYLSKPAQKAQIAEMLRRHRPMRPTSDEVAPAARHNPDLRPEILDSLRQSIGQDGLTEMLTAMEIDAPRLINGLRVAVEKQEAKSIQYFAHTMFSSARQLAAEKLATLCRDVEVRLARDDMAGACRQAIEASENYETLVRDVVQLHGWRQ